MDILRVVNWLIVLTTIWCSISDDLQAQVYKEEVVSFDPDQKYSIHTVLDTIEYQAGVTLSYSTNLFDLQDSVYLANQDYELVYLIELIEQKYAIESTFKRRKKILLYRELAITNPTQKFFGYLKDIESLSSIPSGYIYYDGGSTYTDDNGYFEIDMARLSDKMIYFDVVGYQIDSTDVNAVTPVIISLQHINVLDTFFVFGNTQSDYPDQYLPPQGKLLDAGGISSYGSLTGEPDIITSIRHYSAFDVGGEGRHGLSIRGGSSDQNLVLVDDIPVFEFSHIGGYRSIFLPNAIQSATFTSSGISARYDGKLSSVLDVKLKSPNLKKVEAYGNLGIDAASATVSAPIIKDKWGIIVGGRVRPFRFIDQSLIANILDYESVQLNYNDLLIKSSFVISNDHILSGVFYNGTDIFSYENAESDQSMSNVFNEIGWGNRLHGLKYKGIFSDKLSLKVNLNRSQYYFNSRGAFQSTGGPIIQSYDILSTSENSVTTARAEAQYYHDYGGKTIVGIQYADYLFSPNIYQSSLYKDPTITASNELSQREFEQSEISAFVQSNIPLNEKTTLHAGLKYLELPFESSRFRTIEPRIALHLSGENVKAKLDYTIIHQPIHLLVNPGLGLPSDLWYPSTSDVSPQRSAQFGGSVDFDLDHGQTLGLAVFSKNYDNLIAYEDPTDLLYNIINPNNVVQIPATLLNIEDAILQGNGTARGGEVSYHIQTANIIGWLNYGITYSNREFDDLNGGETFPSRFDRRHSISAGLSYKLAPESNITVQWVYGSGYPFTLNTEVVVNPMDSTMVVLSGSRNNFRMRDYHHLDIRYTYRKQLKKANIQISGGIYNIYNRRNPFYVYVRDVPNENRKELVNVSLFPVLPSFKMNIAF